VLPKPLETLERTVLEIVLEDDEQSQQDTPCEWETCTAPAFFWLICPVCSAREVQFEAHPLMIRKAPITKV
jgi:hypothetical protein